MLFMLILLVISVLLIPVFIFIIKWLYKEWCLSKCFKSKNDDILWYFQVTLKFFLVDILVVVVDLSFIVELLRRY